MKNKDKIWTPIHEKELGKIVYKKIDEEEHRRLLWGKKTTDNDDDYYKRNSISTNSGVGIQTAK